MSTKSFASFFIPPFVKNFLFVEKIDTDEGGDGEWWGGRKPDFPRDSSKIKRGPAGTRTPNQRIMSPSNLRVNRLSKILAANRLCIYFYLKLN